MLVGLDTDQVSVQTRDAGDSAAAFHVVAARGRDRPGFACCFGSGFGSGSGFIFGRGGLALSFRIVSFRYETGHTWPVTTHGWWYTESLMANGMMGVPPRTCSRISDHCEYDGPHIASEIRNLLNVILLVVNSRSALAQGTAGFWLNF